MQYLAKCYMDLQPLMNDPWITSRSNLFLKSKFIKARRKVKCFISASMLKILSDLEFSAHVKDLLSGS